MPRRAGHRRGGKPARFPNRTHRRCSRDSEIPAAALILAAHGSSRSPEPDRAARRHAAALRRRGIFAEVRVAFWKGRPSPREALARIRAREIYIVPIFISEGHFTREVLPRAFGLEGPVTQRGGRRLYYCRPVGVHPAMAEIVVRRAASALCGAAKPRDVCLLLVGHGTERHGNSAAVIRRQARAIRAMGCFGEVHAVFLDQEPRIGRWRDLTDRTGVVVVPFFIASGPHCTRDIPAAIGIATAAGRRVFRLRPHDLGGRRVWYAPPVGNDPGMAGVILDMAAEFDALRFPGTRALLKAWTRSSESSKRTRTPSRLRSPRCSAFPKRRCMRASASSKRTKSSSRTRPSSTTSARARTS